MSNDKNAEIYNFIAAVRVLKLVKFDKSHHVDTNIVIKNFFTILKNYVNYLKLSPRTCPF